MRKQHRILLILHHPNGLNCRLLCSRRQSWNFRAVAGSNELGKSRRLKCYPFICYITGDKGGVPYNPMKRYYCIANDPDGLEIAPRSLARIHQGKYWVPDCVDYQSKFNLPRRIKAKEVFAGWSCHNCKSLREKTDPKKNSKQPDPSTL